MATAASGNASVGTVKIVIGDVKVIGVDGVARQAHVGDKVFAKETIQTNANAIVQVQLENGRTLDLGRDSKIALDDDVLNVGQSPTTAPAAVDADIAALQAQISAGADPSKVAEATAAGGAPGAGGNPDGSGGTAVTLDQANSTGLVTSGFNTAPAGIAFPEIQPQLLPVIGPVAPVASVSVQVTVGTVGVSTGEGGSGGGVIIIPPGTAIPAAGASAINIPEGSGGGTRPVSFLITLDQPASVDVTLTYTIVPGTGAFGASNPDDFSGAVVTGTVTIPAGSLGFIVTENIVQDNRIENNESFTIVLSNPIGVTIVNDTATVTIIDDDHAPVALADTATITTGQTTITGNVLPNDSDSDGDALVVNSSTPITLVSSLGTLVIQPNGSYSFTLSEAGITAAKALDADENIPVVFPNAYQVSDGVNPGNFANVTINISGQNEPPGIVTNSGDPEGANDVVNESALSTGSGGGTSVAAGTFMLSDPDGLDDIKSVTINGITIQIADLGNNNPIPGPNGTLTVTSYNPATGEATYTYQLTSRTTDVNQGESLETNVFTLTTSDGTVSSSPATITIVIADDTPLAANDGPVGVTEDGASSIGGNVLSNDAAGADAPAAFTAWAAGNAANIAALNTYGSLTLNADGSWSYVLDNSRAATQALTAASNLSYDLNYTMQDADGDPSPAKLSITVTGANDGSSVVTAQATGPDGTVLEHGLTSAPDTSETTTGSFTVSSTDGILNVVIGGTTYTLAQVQGFNGTQSVNTGEGILTLTGYSGTATSGTVSYRYTLSATIDNDSKAGATATEFDDSVVLTVNGLGGTTASDTLVIRIVDDIPTISVTANESSLTVDETVLATNASASFAGNFTPVFGADGAGAVSYTLGVNAGATGLVDTVTGLAVNLYVISGQVVGSTATLVGNVNLGNTVFTVSVNGSGVVTLDQMRAVVHPTTDPDEPKSLSADNLVTLTATITDGDGDTANAVLNIGQNITFKDDGPSFTIVNDGNDAGTAVSISAPNPAANTTYVGQFADWAYGADTSSGSYSVTGTGNVVVNTSSTGGVVLDLKDAGGNVVGKLTLNADGTDSLEVLHRSPDLVTDTLLTSDVTASGPSLIKTINSSITGLVITVTASDGDNIPNEAADEVNPSTRGWAVKNNVIEVNESITFSFNEKVERFSFVTDGFTGNPSGGDVGLTVRVFYDFAHTIFQDFTGIDSTDGGSVQVANLPGFGLSGAYTSFYGVNVLSDGDQAGGGGFRLNNVVVSKESSTPPPDLDYNFTLNIADKDGDVASQTFSVHLDGDTTTGGLVVEAIAGTSAADTLMGTIGNDVLIGGGGHDILTGDLGHDTFKFSGTPDANSSDTITDFTMGNAATANSDVLDLHDVLGGISAAVTAVNDDNTVQAGNYIHFTVVGMTATMLVDTTGNGGGQAVAQFAVVSGTNPSTLLADLLANDQMKV